MYGILFGYQMHWIVAKYLVSFFLFPMNVTKNLFWTHVFRKLFTFISLETLVSGFFCLQCFHKCIKSWRYVCNLSKIFTSYIPFFIDEGSTAAAVHMFLSWWFVFVQAVGCPLWQLCCKMGCILLIHTLYSLFNFYFWRGGIGNVTHESSGWWTHNLNSLEYYQYIS